MPSGSIVACETEDDEGEDQLNDTGPVETFLDTDVCIVNHLDVCCKRSLVESRIELSNTKSIRNTHSLGDLQRSCTRYLRSLSLVDKAEIQFEPLNLAASKSEVLASRGKGKPNPAVRLLMASGTLSLPRRDWSKRMKKGVSCSRSP